MTVIGLPATNRSRIASSTMPLISDRPHALVKICPTSLVPRCLAGAGVAGWRRGRGPVVRGGRVPRVLHAHSEIAVLGTLRIESTGAHDGEQTRADRTRHAVAGGSPSCSRCAKDLERAALKGFPNPPATLRCRQSRQA